MFQFGLQAKEVRPRLALGDGISEKIGRVEHGQKRQAHRLLPVPTQLGDAPAAEKGLRPGDVIVEVDQEEVTNPSEVADRVEKARDEGYRVVTLLVLRQGDFQWVAVPIGSS